MLLEIGYKGRFANGEMVVKYVSIRISGVGFYVVIKITFSKFLNWKTCRMPIIQCLILKCLPQNFMCNWVQLQCTKISLSVWGEKRRKHSFGNCFSLGDGEIGDSIFHAFLLTRQFSIENRITLISPKELFFKTVVGLPWGTTAKEDLVWWRSRQAGPTALGTFPAFA